MGKKVALMLAGSMLWTATTAWAETGGADEGEAASGSSWLWAIFVAPIIAAAGGWLWQTIQESKDGILRSPINTDYEDCYVDDWGSELDDWD